MTNLSYQIAVSIILFVQRELRKEGLKRAMIRVRDFYVSENKIVVIYGKNAAEIEIGHLRSAFYSVARQKKSSKH